VFTQQLDGKLATIHPCIPKDWFFDGVWKRCLPRTSLSGLGSDLIYPTRRLAVEFGERCYRPIKDWEVDNREGRYHWNGKTIFK
jgi:hypothetical protein